jgi:hypothetical protein
MKSNMEKYRMHQTSTQVGSRPTKQVLVLIFLNHTLFVEMMKKILLFKRTAGEIGW